MRFAIRGIHNTTIDIDIDTARRCRSSPRVLLPLARVECDTPSIRTAVKYFFLKLHILHDLKN
jgi:hypothetical protein